MGSRKALITMCEMRKRVSLGARGRVACYRQGRNHPEEHTSRELRYYRRLGEEEME